MSDDQKAPAPAVPAPSPDPNAALPTERRSGHDRRRTPFEKRRETIYRKLFRIEPHFAALDDKPDSPVPVPTFALTADQRTDVLLSLHENVRMSIHEWENRIFHAFLLSGGALLSAVAYFLEHSNMHPHSVLFGAAVFMFGVAALTYLYLAKQAHANNGTLLAKIEAALWLCEPGAYIKDAAFFGYTGYWMEDWRTPILMLIHAVVTLFASYTVWFGLG